VGSLLKKYKKAVKGHSDTKNAFNELTQSILPHLIAQWTAAEQEAMLEWGDLLKIFDVKEDNGKTVVQN
jgi:hypothetical protein